MFIRKKKFQEMKEDLDALNKEVEELQCKLETTKEEKESLRCVHESMLKEFSMYKEQLDHRREVDRERQRRYRENHKTK